MYTIYEYKQAIVSSYIQNWFLFNIHDSDLLDSSSISILYAVELIDNLGNPNPLN